MLNLKVLAKGVGYPLRGALYGLVTGVASSFTYILSRIYLNIPNSIPTVEVTFNARKLNLSALEKCYEQKLTDCTLPIDVNLDLDNWTHPILLTTTVATGVGFVAGVTYFGYKQWAKRDSYNNRQYADDNEDDLLMPRIATPRSNQNGCC